MNSSEVADRNLIMRYIYSLKKKKNYMRKLIYLCKTQTHTFSALL